MKTCTYCGRENDPQATHCRECATPLVAESADSEFPQLNPSNKSGCSGINNDVLYGVLWSIGGITVTVLTYFAAASNPSGGHYFVAYGAILYGAFRIFRGLTAASDGPGSRNHAQQLLQTAAQLESVDRAQAVAKYEEIIRLFPGAPASEEAKRNIQTLISHKG